MNKANEKLDTYINKVITDALNATCEKFDIPHEEVNQHPGYWYMIIGKDMIFQCEKVSKNPKGYEVNEAFFRRVVYRMYNNVPGHFGLNFFAPGIDLHCVECSTMKYMICNSDEFPYEKAIIQVEIFGEPFVICSYYPVRPYLLQDDDEMDNWVERSREQGFDVYAYNSFAMYYRAYTKIHKEEPIDTFLRVSNGGPLYFTSADIEEEAKKNLDTYGCTYASICNFHDEKKCKGVDDCHKELARKDGISISKWNAIREMTFEEKYKKYC